MPRRSVILVVLLKAVASRDDHINKENPANRVLALRAALIDAHELMRKHAAESLKHILASDYPNFEVIVIDDGSTDGTSDLVREHDPGA